MKNLSRFVIVFFLFFSLNHFAGNKNAGITAPQQIVSAAGISGIITSAMQRRLPANPSIEAGQVIVTVTGADDIVDLHLKGRSAASRAVRGKMPDKVTSSFSAAIPARDDLVLSLSKLQGRGNVSLSARPTAANGYTVSIRITDSARGKAPYQVKLDWKLPVAAAAAASRTTRAPATKTTTHTTRSPAGTTISRTTSTPAGTTTTTTTRTARTPAGTTTTTRVTQSPAAVSGKSIPARIRKAGAANEGYVEVKLDGVDDVVEVEVRRDKIYYRTIKGKSPRRVAAEFSNPVPSDASITLGIAKSYGRGSITLAEKPVPANGYTTTVRLNDNRGGSANYKFRLNWATAATARSRPVSTSAYPASTYPVQDGHVVLIVDGADDIVDFRIRGDKVEEKVIKGATSRKVTTEFSTPMPLVKIDNLRIEKVYGRGSVAIMEWPEASNDFTTTIRIIDSRKAQDNYRFRLTWKVPGNSSYSNSGYPSSSNNYSTSAGSGSYDNTWVETGNYQRIPAYTGSSFKYTKEGSFHFRALVDETVLIRITGGELWGQVQRGQPMHVLDARFSEGYPNGEMERLEITGFQGRGEIEILERPWNGNNYSIVIRIHDSRGGDAEYAFDLRWKQK